MMNNVNVIVFNMIKEVENAKQDAIDYVKSRLAKMGEQGFNHDGLPFLTMDSLDDRCNEVEFNIDKIKIDEKENLVVHDIYRDEWRSTKFFGIDNLFYLIRFIFWK